MDSSIARFFVQIGDINHEQPIDLFCTKSVISVLLKMWTTLHMFYEISC